MLRRLGRICYAIKIVASGSHLIQFKGTSSVAAALFLQIFFTLVEWTEPVVSGNIRQRVAVITTRGAVLHS